MMMRVIALNSNKTLKYIKNKDYETYMESYNDNYIIIINDLGDNVVVPKQDFRKINESDFKLD